MLNEMESRALQMLLDGQDDRLAVLREQLKAATVTSRELSEITGLRHPAGFLLFVTDGALDVLECFSVDDKWPDGAALERAYYVCPLTARSPSVVETNERDVQWAMGARRVSAPR